MPNLTFSSITFIHLTLDIDWYTFRLFTVFKYPIGLFISNLYRHQVDSGQYTQILTVALRNWKSIPFRFFFCFC